MQRIQRALIVAAVSILPAATAPVISPAFSDRYSITTIASGLSFPIGMQRMGDGSLLVGTTAAAVHATWGKFYYGDGTLTKVSPNGQTSTVATLRGAVTSVKTAGPLVVAATTGDGVGATGLGHADISFLSETGGSYSEVGNVHFHFASGGPNVATEVRPAAGQPGKYDLFFALAALENDGTPGSSPVNVTGLIAAQLDPGAVYKVEVQTGAGAPTVTAPQKVAYGIRNAGGLLADSNGNLWFTDNGYSTGATGTSVDELNVIAPSAQPVFYGYPGNYTALNGDFIGGQGVAPFTSFTALGGLESVGASELAFSPSIFPDQGVFVGFHGKSNVFGAANTTNPLMFVDSATGEHTWFMAPGQADMGNLDSLLATGDALYVARFSATAYGGGSGEIYKITANTPEPGFGTGVAAVLGLVAIYRRKRATPTPVSSDRIRPARTEPTRA